MATQVQDALSGAWLEIAHVTDPMTTEEEVVVVSNTYDSPSIEMDGEDVEVPAHASEVTYRFRTHKTIDCTFQSFWVPTAPQLEQMGLLDQDTGEFILDDTWEACRIYVYDQPPNRLADDADAVDVVELPNFNVMLGEIELPTDDPINVETSGYVNGIPQLLDPADIQEAVSGTT